MFGEVKSIWKSFSHFSTSNFTVTIEDHQAFFLQTLLDVLHTSMLTIKVYFTSTLLSETYQVHHLTVLPYLRPFDMAGFLIHSYIVDLSSLRWFRSFLWFPTVGSEIGGFVDAHVTA